MLHRFHKPARGRAIMTDEKPTTAMPEVMLDLHIAIASALDADNEKLVNELRDLLERVRRFYVDRGIS